MKKVLSILMALLMVFALFACNKPAAPENSTDPSAPAETSAAPNSPDETDIAPGTEESAAPEEMVDITKNADEIGFFESGVDPQSRDTYQIVHMYPYTLLLYELMTQCFQHFGEALNCEVTPSTSEFDMDVFIQNIEIFASQGNTDGIIVVIHADAADRINEVLLESGIPYVGWCNSYRDASGSELIPSVGLEQYGASATTVQWLYDNYKTYWGDIDTSKIALLNANVSSNVDLNERAVAAAETFNELIPNNAGVFEIDMVADFTQETAYNYSSATFSANPDIEYWFSTNCVEMYSQGVARAVEQLKLEDKVLITDVGSDILCSEWETGYDGCWVSCLAISNYLYAAPAICAVVALIDGTATWDTLWTDKRAPGDLYTFYGAESTMITKDTYKDYFNTYAELAGDALPYPG